MASQPFHLQSHLDDLHATSERMLGFRAASREAWATWRSTLRARVLTLTGLAGRQAPPVQAPETIHVEPRAGYTETKLALPVGEGVQVPLYLLTPDEAAPPYKPILVFHGHNPNAQYMLGNYPDAETAARMVAKDNNYAQALAQAGYFVAAVEQRGFGERLSDGAYGGHAFENSCRHLAFEYMLQGRTLLGERIWDGMRVIDYLRTRADLVPDALGVTGNSGGGTTALWLAAVEERVTVAVPASYLCSFKASILGCSHCECNYVPGVLQWAEMGDIAALIAPRPVRFIHGEKDEIFPIAATRAQFATVQAAYDLLGVGEQADLAVHDGPHAYKHAFAHEWFGRWL